MPLRLVIHPLQGPVRYITLKTANPYLIGRGIDSDIRIADARLSRRHARLVCQAGTCLLTDLGSKNGTMVDGRPAGQTPVLPGSWISFGGLLAHLEKVSDAQLAAEEAMQKKRLDTSQRMRTALDPALGAAGLLRRLLDSVLVLSNTDRGFIVLLRQNRQMDIVCAKGLTNTDSGDFSGSATAVALALQSRRVLVASDTGKSAALAAQSSIVGGGIQALVCVPLDIEDNLTGVIYADSSRPGIVFTELDTEILKGIGEQASLALSADNVRRQLEDIHDLLAQAAPAQELPGSALYRALRHGLKTVFADAADGS